MGLNKYRTTTVSVSNAPSRAKMKTQDGDIVIALTRPHRGAIAQIKESGVISSTGFSVIRKVVTQIDREWLLFVLLSNLSLQQMLQRSSGGNYPAIIEDEVKRIYIPIVDYSKQLQMAANMRTKAKEFDAQIQTSNSFLNNTLFILERVGLTFDKDNNNLAFAITRSIVEDRIDADYYSEAFDFYCEYAKFDFSRFDVSWLLNLYPHTLEQIAKNAKVKERVRVAIATTLDGEAIAPSDSQRLQSILVKHFC